MNAKWCHLFTFVYHLPQCSTSLTMLLGLLNSVTRVLVVAHCRAFHFNHEDVLLHNWEGWLHCHGNAWIILPWEHHKIMACDLFLELSPRPFWVSWCNKAFCSEKFLAKKLCNMAFRHRKSWSSTLWALNLWVLWKN